MTLCIDLVKQYMRDNPQLKVLIVDNERNVNVGTEGHTDWDKLKGMGADSVVFDDLLCKPVAHTVKNTVKPTYTQLLGRRGK